MHSQGNFLSSVYRVKVCLVCGAFFFPFHKLFGDKSVLGNVDVSEDTLQAERKIHQSHYLL